MLACLVPAALLATSLKRGEARERRDAARHEATRPAPLLSKPPFHAPPRRTDPAWSLPALAAPLGLARPAVHATPPGAGTHRPGRGRLGPLPSAGRKRPRTRHASPPPDECRLPEAQLPEQARTIVARAETGWARCARRRIRVGCGGACLGLAGHG